jgi:hypothetical protein
MAQGDHLSRENISFSQAGNRLSSTDPYNQALTATASGEATSVRKTFSLSANYNGATPNDPVIQQNPRARMSA